MNGVIPVDVLKEKLLERKHFLNNSSQKYMSTSDIMNFINEIDDAIERMNNGTYGICEVCGDHIEPEQLEANPLIRVCIGDMNAEQQRNLEEDLKLAVKVQRNLLPPGDILLDGWEIANHYEPASIVSGDYCDLILPDDKKDQQYIIVGDVSGKGVAASMLMTHLHATFHTLVSFDLELGEIMSRMNRILCESTFANQFATLVLAKTSIDGSVEISNAGHCLPVLITEDGISEPGSNGIPLGIMCGSTYECSSIKMKPGDVLILYTDGLTEAMNGDDCFELERVLRYQKEFRYMSTGEIIETINRELNKFLGSLSKSDDLTLMVLKKL